jgi:hypothetical protein
MLKITSAANAAHLRSKRNIRAHHQTSATSQPVVPEHCRESCKQPGLDQAKEPGMHVVNAKPPFGNVARTNLQTQEKGSAAVVMKGLVAQIAPTSTEPDAEIFFDESLSPITGVALKEIRQLARSLTVIVLIPNSTVADQIAPHKILPAKSSSASSETTKLLGILGKAVERFKSTSEESMVTFGDVTVNFSTMEALRTGEPVVLTIMEFKTEIFHSECAPRDFTRRTAQRGLGIRELSLYTNSR